MQPTPPRRLVFTGRTRERGKDPAGAQTTFSLITHIKFGKFGNFFLQASRPSRVKESLPLATSNQNETLCFPKYIYQSKKWYEQTGFVLKSWTKCQNEEKNVELHVHSDPVVPLRVSGSVTCEASNRTCEVPSRKSSCGQTDLFPSRGSTCSLPYLLDSNWILTGVIFNSNWNILLRGISHVVMNDLVLLFLSCLIVLQVGVLYCSVCIWSHIFCWFHVYTVFMIVVLLTCMYF